MAGERMAAVWAQTLLDPKLVSSVGVPKDALLRSDREMVEVRVSINKSW